MTRQKLKLAYIPNDSVRKATFQNRKKGIMKKAHELSVLCGVDVCAIICSPYNTEPDIWPPNPLSVRRVLSRYNEIPEVNLTKKTSNLESHLKQRIGKALEQCNKQRRDNREKEVNLMMHNVLNGQILPIMNVEDVYDLISIIDRNLKDIYTRFQMMGDEGCSSGAKQPGSVTTLVEQPLLSMLEDNGRKFRS